MPRGLPTAIYWVLLPPLAVIAFLLAADATHDKSCQTRPPPGTVIQIPGERMEILPPRDDSRDLLALDVVRDPYDDPGFELRARDGHIHPHQDERFEVLSGKARFLIGDRIVDLGPGGTGVVPRGTLHNWMAMDGKPVRVTAYFEPALDIDAWFVNFHKHIALADLDLVQAAVISREFERGAPMPVEPPAFVWNLAAKMLAPLGRLFGYSAC